MTCLVCTRLTPPTALAVPPSRNLPHAPRLAVAQRFLVDIPNLDEGVQESIAHHMAFAHQAVTEASHKCARVAWRGLIVDSGRNAMQDLSSWVLKP